MVGTCGKIDLAHGGAHEVLAASSGTQDFCTSDKPTLWAAHIAVDHDVGLTKGGETILLHGSCVFHTQANGRGGFATVQCGEFLVGYAA